MATSVMHVLMLLALCSLSLICSERLTVLQTSDDLSQFRPETGAELYNSSLFGHQKVTICARFLTHQFTTHRYTKGPWHSLLALPDIWILWSGWYPDIVSGSLAGKFSSWDLGALNHVCVILDATANLSHAIINGKMVSNTAYRHEHSILPNNLSIMGHPHEKGLKFSLFGRMTDVNIWSRSLTEEETSAWTSCDMTEGGNLLDWRNASWRTQGLVEVQVEREEICIEKSKFWVSTIKRNFQGHIHYANIMKGQLMVLNDEHAVELVTKIWSTNTVQKVCPMQFFNGFTKRNPEGNFVSLYTREELKYNDWIDGEPNNFGGAEDCLSVANGKLFDSRCDDELCSIVQLNQTPKFQLRGVCEGSEVDIFYTIPLYNETLFRKEVLGLKQTKIIWSPEQKRWNIVNLVDLSILAHTNNTKEYPFGTHSWFFTNSSCTDPGRPWREMNLQQKSDQPGQFCCWDGLCIDSQYRCDDTPNCRDYSDEIGCEIIQVPRNRYSKKNPPKPRNQTDKQLLVNTSIILLDIIAIDEVASVISLMFKISFQWTDSRLTYNFLKNDIDQNTMSDIGGRIWMPEVVFLVQSDPDKSMMIDHKVSLEKLGNVSISGGMDSLHANETYSGKENPLTLISTYKGDFVCTFDGMYSYPFDQENCQVEFYLSGKANYQTLLFPHDMLNNGPNYVGQYNVRSWIVVPFTSPHGRERGLRFSVDLGRNLVSIFLVTYLPTFLMNLINQATNYIDDNYEMTLTINITCMMVLASVYISVSSCLPPTASIKYIEIWLLFNLSYPVMVILVNVVLKVTKQ